MFLVISCQSGLLVQAGKCHEIEITMKLVRLMLALCLTRPVTSAGTTQTEASKRNPVWASTVINVTAEKIVSQPLSSAAITVYLNVITGISSIYRAQSLSTQNVTVTEVL